MHRLMSGGGGLELSESLCSTDVEKALKELTVILCKVQHRHLIIGLMQTCIITIIMDAFSIAIIKSVLGRVRS